MNDQQREDLYGPAATHSEHQRGEYVAFLEEGKTYTGVILWVCAARELEKGTSIPICYIVEAEQQEGFPCIVAPGDIIERQNTL